MTTTTIQLDAVGGMAGDMFVAAMIDALPELRDRALADAAAVLPPGAGTPLLDSGTSGGLRCLRFRLSGATQQTDGDHAHAGFLGMVARIEDTALASGTAPEAIAILRHLAEAEAAIHGVPLGDVHFHEIGDWDSLMDVVAAGSIAAALPAARWTVSDLPRGGGLVRTQHGLLPVPAPATTRLLQGFTWRDDGISGERVTPTGAAILRHLVANATAPAAGRLRASGTGAGTRDLPGQPNVLRVTIFDEVAGPASDFTIGTEDILVLSFDIDDMTGEEIGVAAERLRQLAGVRDLVVLSALGKKGRPVHAFRLLLRFDDQASVAAACFTETSTIGLRWRQERRMVLARELGTAKAPNVRVKTAIRPAGDSRKAESDDLAEIEGLESRRAAKRQAEEAE
ncbi:MULTISPECIES: LarC family nickel insertion protein [unclassified Acidisoma]|uniref:LarC family nickel insertion protein n=1 Tax=unclassified Acidisoma TaxID=2634065 RepID=UPI001C201ECF|nr:MULTISPECIES: LarC family nickel insertion protein [unclassified Acidisoma]